MRALSHTLRHPIIIEKKLPGSDEIVEEELKPAGFTVAMRRPKAKDMRAFDRHGDAGIAAIIELIVSCSNLGTIEAENLDADDFGELGNLLEPRGLNSPPDWRACLIALARGLHFQPGALLDLTADDLEFWLSAAEQFEAQTKQE